MGDIKRHSSPLQTACAVIQGWRGNVYYWVDLCLNPCLSAWVQFVAATWLRAASSWGTVTICAPWTSRGFMARPATSAGNLWRVRWWQSWGRPTIPPALCATFASKFKVPAIRSCFFWHQWDCWNAKKDNIRAFSQTPSSFKAVQLSR